MTRQGALRLLEALPTSDPSLDPCQVANPTLWTVWCDLRGRPDPLSPSVWTEVDVVASSVMMLNRHLRAIGDAQ
jgi:hypothetical protein